MRSEIQQKLVEFFVARGWLDSSELISSEESLLDSGVLDSLAILELVHMLDEEFAILVSEDELVPEHFDTLAGLEQFIVLKRDQ